MTNDFSISMRNADISKQIQSGLFNPVETGASNTIFPMPCSTSMSPYDIGFSTTFNMNFMMLMMQMQAIQVAFANAMKNLRPGESMQVGAPSPHRANLTKLSPECDKRIDAISQRLNCNPDDFKAVIYAESGGDPKARNASSGATGFIQFRPDTARDFGTSTDALAQMSAEQQLVYVEKYLQRAKGQAKFAPDHKLTSGELYALVFMPAKAKQEVLCSVGSSAYRQNKGLDVHKDGQVTKSDLTAKMDRVKRQFFGFFS
ncbi:MAG: transglycosylase SLT domain-containing protein [bacterium]